MKLAIMQPYFFPYVGYFQLVSCVDCFVFYDDVGFIKQGWINRNRVLVNGRAHLVTVPVRPSGISSPIHKTPVDAGHFPRWRVKVLRLLAESYARAPFREPTLQLAEEALAPAQTDIGSLARRSVELTCRYLGLERRSLISSIDLPAQGSRGVDRVLEICRALGATEYVNLPGGRSLYQEGRFREAGIRLRFLEPRLDPYPQGTASFVPRLSILDLLAHMAPEGARAMTSRGSLT